MNRRVAQLQPLANATAQLPLGSATGTATQRGGSKQDCPMTGKELRAQLRTGESCAGCVGRRPAALHRLRQPNPEGPSLPGGMAWREARQRDARLPPGYRPAPALRVLRAQIRRTGPTTWRRAVAVPECRRAQQPTRTRTWLNQRAERNKPCAISERRTWSASARVPQSWLKCGNGKRKNY